MKKRSVLSLLAALVPMVGIAARGMPNSVPGRVVEYADCTVSGADCKPDDNCRADWNMKCFKPPLPPQSACADPNGDDCWCCALI